jgi:hypothetical protein
MATSVNSPLGDFRKKIGGMVGSRNASGAIIRKRTKPTNPKTPAQKAARVRFSNATMGWKTVAQTFRAGWETFAKTGFNPLRKTNKGQYTGAQTYVGIQTSLAGANSGLSLTSLAAFASTPVNATIPTVPIAVTDIAPLSSVQGNIYDSTVGSYPLSLVGIQLTTAGILAADLRITAVGATGPTGPKMQDGKQKSFGFLFYFSEALTFSGKRAANPFHSVAGFTGIWPTTAISAGATSGFRVSTTVAAQLANWKQSPSLGNTYQVTVVGVGSDGTQVVIGKAYCTVAAALTAAPTA